MSSSNRKKPTKRATQLKRWPSNRQYTSAIMPETSTAMNKRAGKRGRSRALNLLTNKGTRKQTSYGRSSSRVAKPAQKISLGMRIASSRPAIIFLTIIVVFVFVGVFDTVSHWDKAYGNISINGLNVGGMTSSEMYDALKTNFGLNISRSKITIYANNKAKTMAMQKNGLIASEEEVAEELSYDDANESVSSWNVDALSLKATIPYDEAIDVALSYGRENGGILERLNLLFNKRNVSMTIKLDETSLESLAAEIDLSIGDPCVDNTVEIVEGEAKPVEGKSGTMVDRNWLHDVISRALMSGNTTESIVAQATISQSRISSSQATDMAQAINRAISEGAVFSYQGKTWFVDPVTLGNLINVAIVEDQGIWKLVPSINSSSIIPLVIENVSAEITTDDIVVTFEVSGKDIVVHTSGNGSIPEVSTAVEELQTKLFGDSGIAWGTELSQPITVEIGKSGRPEMLSFDDAINLGIVSVIGEYTTEFSNVEGTENRNHNIMLAADILNNGIIEGHGGIWSFNSRSGDTNEQAGFWTAGSIVDGEYVDSVGGGICQVATTVFNAVLESGLEISERHNHSLYIASYPTGRDAAVDYPSDLDLVWKNELESDILLKLSYTDSSITAQLYSVQTGYHSAYVYDNWEEGEKYKTLFEYDDTLGEGNYYRKTAGEDGSKISVSRTVTNENGSEIRSDFFSSKYDPKNEVYVIGPNVDTSLLTTKDDSEE